jgi:hypothetical protein
MAYIILRAGDFVDKPDLMNFSPEQFIKKRENIL